jgi:hypothetical protein
MLRHIVFFKFKDHAEGASKADNLLKAKALLEGCKQLVPGMLECEVALAKEGMDCSADLVLYTVFTDAAALDAYQNHPTHVALKGFLGAVREQRHCMDYEV